jgi:spectinomycin phosphotransferase
VRDAPTGLGEGELRRALADGWRIRATAMRYAPVGGGSYHWVVHDGHGERWFVTADDLDHKGWLGDTRPAAFDGLRAAMDTALALRSRAGLEFVVAPVSSDGATTRLLGTRSRYAVTVFPFLDGASGQFGQMPTAAERAELVGMLAALHESTPTAIGARRRVSELPWRGALEAALAELDRPWTGGPFAEPARALLNGAAGQVRTLMRGFDELACQVAARAAVPVITHGEPHPGNVIRVDGKLMLVDWDTLALAPAERDLWMLASDDGEALRGYTEATGRVVDEAALELYRLRWTLDDICAFVRQLRSAHGHTAGAEHAWRSLTQAISLASRAG